MTTHRAVTLTLAVVMIVTASHSSAWAAEGDVLFGGQWWTQTAREAKYQEFRQVPLGGLLEQYRLQEWGGRTGFALWGANGLYNDQASRLTVSNGVRWRADLGYTQIPHTFSHVARWGWGQGPPGVFAVPDALQAANQTTPANFGANMSDFLKSAPIVGLDFNSHLSTARLRARPMRGWQFEARGGLRNRSGFKPYGITFGSPGTGPIENPEPIDQRTVDADLIANYQRNGLRMRASGGVSIFDNAITTLLVDNPRRNTDVSGGNGARTGALDLYPDNQQVRGSVAVTTVLPRRTALAATLGVAQTTQDDPFLGFTTNTAIVTGPVSINDSLPAKNADAKAIQLNGDVRLSTNLMEDLKGVVRFNYSDYDNQTPEVNFLGRVPYEASLQRYLELHNKAYANTQWHTGVDLDYRVTPAVKVGATYEYRDRERNHREVEKDNENVFKGRARVRPQDALEITAEYRHGDRQLDHFLIEDYIGLTQTGNLFDTPDTLEQPTLRRFDVANRVQDRADAGVNYIFSERFEAGATYTYLKNDYKDSPMGLTDETEHNVAVDGTFHAHERLDLTGAYGYGFGETNQASRQSGTSQPSNNPADDWDANLKDTDVYVAAGFLWSAVPEKLSLSADYEFSRHIQEFDLSNATNTAVDVPQTLYRWHDVTVNASYRWLQNITLIGRYGWEQYDIVDFATNNVPLVFPATGTSSAIYLGDSAQSYRAHRLALLARWTF